MQTIRINTISRPWGCDFAINGKEIAGIGSDFLNPSKYSARFGVYASGNNIATFADAVEFIGDAICSHFAQFGLNVEFVNA